VLHGAEHAGRLLLPAKLSAWDPGEELGARRIAPSKHILRLRGSLARRIRVTRDWNITCSLPASRSAPSSSKHPKLEWNISRFTPQLSMWMAPHTEARG